jgi:hypothetical protein
MGQKPPLSLPPPTTGAGGPAAQGESALGLGTAGTLVATSAGALAALLAMTQSIDEKSHLPGLEQVKKADEDYVRAQERLTQGQQMLANSRDSMQAFGLINEIAGLRESIARSTQVLHQEDDVLSTQVPQRERDVPFSWSSSFSWSSDAVSKVITQTGYTTQPGIATMLLGAGYQPPAAAPDWSTVPATAPAGMLVLGVEAR